MSGPKPHVLFVHGSWHTPAHFAPVRAVFEEAGYPTSCFLEPSIGRGPPTSLPEDAAAIRAGLARLVEQEGAEVVVIGHSYGGMVVSQAVDASLGRADRVARGLPGGVVHLIYLCAFVVGVGESLVDMLGGKLPPFIPVDEHGMCTMDSPGDMFYHDVPGGEPERARWVAELRPCSAATQTAAITANGGDVPAYLHHPATYVFCTDDRGLPEPVQRAMVARARERCAAAAANAKTAAIPSSSGSTADAYFREEVLASGHSPYLSMPEAVLGVVQRLPLEA